MVSGAFNFAEPVALLLLVLLPLWWWRVAKSGRGESKEGRWRKYADKHLLPYLLLSEARSNEGKRKNSKIKPVLQSLAWVLLVVALAGPRWEFTKIDVFEPDAAVMVVLDISRSMLAEDVAPSRMARARAAVSDLLDMAKLKGVRVGLIAFAAKPYIISPISSDTEMIKQLLPSVSPDLAGIQGSEPVEALELASRQLSQLGEASGLSNMHIYFITDGDFAETKDELRDWVSKMRSSENSITMHTLLIASDDGGAVPDIGGGFMSGEGAAAHISKPDEGLIKDITSDDGVFIHSGVGNDDVVAIIDSISKSVQDRKDGKGSELVWKEQFLPFLLAGMVFVLVRSPMLFCILIVLPQIVLAEDKTPLRNDLPGLVYFNKGNYEGAAAMLDDPYRRGVALYRAGKYADAINSFSGQENPASLYDLGNSYFQERNYQAAADSYRKVLEKEPDNKDAEYNLKLAEAMMKKQSGGGGNNQQQQNKQDSQEGQQQEQQQQSSGDDNKQGKQNDNQQQNGNNGNESQQPESKSDEQLDRMLREIQGDPGELLKKRVEQQDREAIKGRYVSHLSPW